MNYHLVKIGEADRWKVISACGQDIPHSETVLVTHQINQAALAVNDMRQTRVNHPCRTTLPSTPYISQTLLHLVSTFSPFHRRDEDWSHRCNGETISVLSLQVTNFTFDYLGNLKPIEFAIADSTMAHKLSVVDLDRKDMRMAVYVDDCLFGLITAMEPDPKQDCGHDMLLCLHMQFSAGVVIIPPGRHIIRIEPLNEGGFHERE